MRKRNSLVPLLIIAFLALSGISVLIYQLIWDTRIRTQDDVPRISVQEAYQASISGEAILVDNRAASQYEASHVAGAINIPLEQLDEAILNLDKGQWYITYCT